MRSQEGQRVSLNDKYTNTFQEITAVTAVLFVPNVICLDASKTAPKGKRRYAYWFLRFFSRFRFSLENQPLF